MTAISWQVSGEYFEACNCDYLCPCIPSNLTAKPTHGHCDVGLVFHVDQGHSGDVSLDGVNFVIVAHTPGVMADGDWAVGLIIDERASHEQAEAIAGIASGQAGGPMSGLSPLIGTFSGIERKPIAFQANGMSRSISVPGVIDQAVEGVPSAAAEGEPLYVENTIHPANSRLALATASHAHIHAFGIDWDETSGDTNGHFARFEWHG